ncbi:Cell morphogenesis protein PAG1 [Porphyridium purpureum]|uniref:Cell morphogenesis protein PAG1 n=1 Tax=Porphyridium purpureum TaxID=35688 RepID=A0A5J4YXM2_PORPP|nr:Cell morphogenesis protein PAG1 [Porphyridium purpureum]|eukprot:POR7573..scf209_3
MSTSDTSDLTGEIFMTPRAEKPKSTRFRAGISEGTSGAHPSGAGNSVLSPGKRSVKSRSGADSASIHHDVERVHADADSLSNPGPRSGNSSTFTKRSKGKHAPHALKKAKAGDKSGSLSASKSVTGERPSAGETTAPFGGVPISDGILLMRAVVDRVQREALELIKDLIPREDRRVLGLDGTNTTPSESRNFADTSRPEAGIGQFLGARLLGGAHASAGGIVAGVMPVAGAGVNTAGVGAQGQTTQTKDSNVSSTAAPNSAGAKDLGYQVLSDVLPVRIDPLFSSGEARFPSSLGACSQFRTDRFSGTQQWSLDIETSSGRPRSFIDLLLVCSQIEAGNEIIWDNLLRLLHWREFILFSDSADLVGRQHSFSSFAKVGRVQSTSKIRPESLTALVTRATSGKVTALEEAWLRMLITVEFVLSYILIEFLYAHQGQLNAGGLSLNSGYLGNGNLSTADNRGSGTFTADSQPVARMRSMIRSHAIASIKMFGVPFRAVSTWEEATLQNQRIIVEMYGRILAFLDYPGSYASGAIEFKGILELELKKLSKVTLADVQDTVGLPKLPLNRALVHTPFFKAEESKQTRTLRDSVLQLEVLYNLRFCNLGYAHDHPDDSVALFRLFLGLVSSVRKPEVMLALADVLIELLGSMDPSEIPDSNGWDRVITDLFRMFYTQKILASTYPVCAALLAFQNESFYLENSKLFFRECMRIIEVPKSGKANQSLRSGAFRALAVFFFFDLKRSVQRNWSRVSQRVMDLFELFLISNSGTLLMEPEGPELIVSVMESLCRYADHDFLMNFFTALFEARHCRTESVTIGLRAYLNVIALVEEERELESRGRSSSRPRQSGAVAADMERILDLGDVSRDMDSEHDNNNYKNNTHASRSSLDQVSTKDHNALDATTKSVTGQEISNGLVSSAYLSARVTRILVEASRFVRSEVISSIQSHRWEQQNELERDEGVARNYSRLLLGIECWTRALRLVPGDALGYLHPQMIWPGSKSLILSWLVHPNRDVRTLACELIQILFLRCRVLRSSLLREVTVLAFEPILSLMRPEPVILSPIIRLVRQLLEYQSFFVWKLGSEVVDRDPFDSSTREQGRWDSDTSVMNLVGGLILHCLCSPDVAVRNSASEALHGLSKLRNVFQLNKVKDLKPSLWRTSIADFARCIPVPSSSTTAAPTIGDQQDKGRIVSALALSDADREWRQVLVHFVSSCTAAKVAEMPPAISMTWNQILSSVPRIAASLLDAPKKTGYGVANLEFAKNRNAKVAPWFVPYWTSYLQNYIYFLCAAARCTGSVQDVYRALRADTADAQEDCNCHISGEAVRSFLQLLIRAWGGGDDPDILDLPEDVRNIIHGALSLVHPFAVDSLFAELDAELETPIFLLDEAASPSRHATKDKKAGRLRRNEGILYQIEYVYMVVARRMSTCGLLFTHSATLKSVVKHVRRVLHYFMTRRGHGLADLNGSTTATPKHPLYFLELVQILIHDQNEKSQSRVATTAAEALDVKTRTGLFDLLHSWFFSEHRSRFVNGPPVSKARKESSQANLQSSWGLDQAPSHLETTGLLEKLTESSSLIKSMSLCLMGGSWRSDPDLLIEASEPLVPTSNELKIIQWATAVFQSGISADIGAVRAGLIAYVRATPFFGNLLIDLCYPTHEGDKSRLAAVHFFITLCQIMLVKLQNMPKHARNMHHAAEYEFHAKIMTMCLLALLADRTGASLHQIAGTHVKILGLQVLQLLFQHHMHPPEDVGDSSLQHERRLGFDSVSQLERVSFVPRLIEELEEVVDDLCDFLTTELKFLAVFIALEMITRLQHSFLGHEEIRRAVRALSHFVRVLTPSTPQIETVTRHLMMLSLKYASENTSSIQDIWMAYAEKCIAVGMSLVLAWTVQSLRHFNADNALRIVLYKSISLAFLRKHPRSTVEGFCRVVFSSAVTLRAMAYADPHSSEVLVSEIRDLLTKKPELTFPVDPFANVDVPAAEPSFPISYSDGALVLLSDLAYESGDELRPFLPWLLHGALIRLDCSLPIVSYDCKLLVCHLVHALVIRQPGRFPSKAEYDEAEQEVQKLFSVVLSSKPSLTFWSWDESEALNAKISSFVDLVVAPLSRVEIRLCQTWSTHALLFASSARSFHFVYRSLQVLCGLKPSLDAELLRVLILGLCSCTEGAKYDQTRDIVSELWLTIATITCSAETRSLYLYPQLLWAAVAYIQGGTGAGTISALRVICSYFSKLASWGQDSEYIRFVQGLLPQELSKRSRDFVPALVESGALWVPETSQIASMLLAVMALPITDTARLVMSDGSPKEIFLMRLTASLLPWLVSVLLERDDYSQVGINAKVLRMPRRVGNLSRVVSLRGNSSSPHDLSRSNSGDMDVGRQMLKQCHSQLRQEWFERLGQVSKAGPKSDENIPTESENAGFSNAEGSALKDANVERMDGDLASPGISTSEDDFGHARRLRKVRNALFDSNGVADEFKIIPWSADLIVESLSKVFDSDSLPEVVSHWLSVLCKVSGCMTLSHAFAVYAENNVNLTSTDFLQLIRIPLCSSFFPDLAPEFLEILLSGLRVAPKDGYLQKSLLDLLATALPEMSEEAVDKICETSSVYIFEPVADSLQGMHAKEAAQVMSLALSKFEWRQSGTDFYSPYEHENESHSRARELEVQDMTRARMTENLELILDTLQSTSTPCTHELPYSVSLHDDLMPMFETMALDDLGKSALRLGESAADREPGVWDDVVGRKQSSRVTTVLTSRTQDSGMSKRESLFGRILPARSASMSQSAVPGRERESTGTGKRMSDQMGDMPKNLSRGFADTWEGAGAKVSSGSTVAVSEAAGPPERSSQPVRLIPSMLKSLMSSGAPRATTSTAGANGQR